ncbi:MAG: CBS domain-containing protein [Gammaproteobacteria bacterium]|nr:CBS domain-containing protein [Gammaproteobacteria bacterium]NIN60846.1 CBS domain-containing protein [Gammaproteobacteria bacterium]NIO62469.1 CBS domain-containing protein [Gammaproteobacteria bacterium]NIP49613.1 CBS domain-containing protein [Gammaproteobacteria bacterium]NIQ10838.1 CBS domain-containing protein [Gammaproteobacteria bacterium]
MTTVRQILEEKGYIIHSVSPDSLVYDAIKLMSELGVGALLVLEKDKLTGIFSERDYTRKIVLQERSSKSTKVCEIMTQKVFYMTPDQSIEDCMATMTRYHFRHLPVLENGKPIGMLNVMDVMGFLLSDKEFIINQLEGYISGTSW